MRLTTPDCWDRLTNSTFGVLGTVDAAIGVHLVPVVFAVSGETLAVPIDRVKQKASPRLRRITNLEQDSRASLLVDHRSSDWDQLWWVRADMSFVGAVDPDAWLPNLGDRYPMYTSASSVTTVITFAINSLSGWQALGSHEGEGPSGRSH
ncbi:MAG TPA: pyridoxamine 5'-phosphate oxidase family protein [Acidimicrobiia bacterium]|nr:pyridoxamine 5'-phosphate oxidase family protein [Acidimicrobiia bacterium]